MSKLLTRLTLTSHGLLLILAVIAACGIFLLDLFYLKPRAEMQEIQTIRQEALRTERLANLTLANREEGLRRTCAALAESTSLVRWARDPDGLVTLGGAPPSAGATDVPVPEAVDATVLRTLQNTEVETAWITAAGSRPRLLRGWTTASHEQPPFWSRVESDDAEPRPAPAGLAGSPVATQGAGEVRPTAFGPDATGPLAESVRRLLEVGPHSSSGLIELADGIALFARRPIHDPADPTHVSGYLWLALPLHPTVLRDVSAVTAGEVVFVADSHLPGRQIDPREPLDHLRWQADGDNLHVAWLLRDYSGRTLGYVSARLSAVAVLRQASAARRMVLIVLSLSVGLAVLVIVGTHMLVTGPVVRLLRRLQQLETGESTPEELARDLHGEPLMLARRLESTFDKLARISKTDELTGLANRRHFEEVLECFYFQARRYNRPLSLMVMDVDFFKAVNDAAGHQTGDELLRKVAEAIEQACRKADLPARLGGDEFAVLLPETGSPAAAAVGERILKAVRGIGAEINALKMNVTLSIGVTDLNVAEVDAPGAMLRVADQALYSAKELGRNRIVTGHELDGTLSAESNKVEKLCEKLAGLDNEFKGIFLRAIQEIIQLLEHRDPHMADHARKVQHYAVLIGREMGLPDRITSRLQIAGMLHDVGMLAMPDSVLLCPSQLDDTQVKIMRRHPLLSVRIMEGMEFLEQEIPAVRYHHERYDGTGYPENIAGPAIPLSARILAVADCFDALTTDRTYRDAMSLTDALGELRREAGTQFDPAVVDAMIAVAERMGESIFDVPGREGTNWVRDLLYLQAEADDSPAQQGETPTSSPDAPKTAQGSPPQPDSVVDGDTARADAAAVGEHKPDARPHYSAK